MASRQQCIDQLAAEKSAITALLLALSIECQQSTLDGRLEDAGMKCRVCEYFIDGDCDLRKALRS